MDSDEADKFEEVKTFLAKNKMEWSQAKLASIKSLIETAYRIQEYPSAILLGPDGKVLVLDQKELSGEKLYETLERILPKQKYNRVPTNTISWLINRASEINIKTR